MDNNGQQWTAMDNIGQQWTTMDINGLQWTTIRGATCISDGVFVFSLCCICSKYRICWHLVVIIQTRPLPVVSWPTSGPSFHSLLLWWRSLSLDTYFYLYLKYCNCSIVIEILYLQYCIWNIAIEILYLKYCICSIVIEILYLQYCIWNIAF